MLRPRFWFDLALVALVWAALSLRAADFLPQVLTRSELERAVYYVYPIAHSDYLIYTLPPNTTIQGEPFGTITTNAFGFRGAWPHTLAKTPDQQRILFLGDSFTLGWGVDEADSLPSLVQADLAAQPPQRAFEVINGGYHAGGALDSYYAYLQREGDVLQPDALVIVIFSGNDLEDIADARWLETDADGAPLRLSTVRMYTDYQGRFLNLENFPWYYQTPILNENRYGLLLAERLTTSLQSVKTGRLQPSLSDEDAWARLVLVAHATDRLLKAREIPYGYVVIPTPGHTLEQDPYGARLQALLRDTLCVPYLSLHGQIDPATHMIPNDGHLNAAGNRRVADLVTPWLLAWGG
jgi:lysophospholipase L1-like esterase